MNDNTSEINLSDWVVSTGEQKIKLPLDLIINAKQKLKIPFRQLV